MQKLKDTNHSFKSVSLSLVAMLSFGAPALSKDMDKTKTVKDFAAAYYAGDGLGFNRNIVLEPDGSFKFKWTGCMGVYGESTGTAKLVNGIIELPPYTAKDIKQPTSLTPVKWGERLYLIETEKLLDFCNDINQQREPRKDKKGFTFMRLGDEQKDASKAQAELPKEWREFILTKPLKGTVVKKLNGNTAEIDLGAKDGLKKGMLLTSRGKNTFTQIRVVEASDHTCVVKKEYRDDKLTAGDVVSSLFFPE